MPRCCENAKWLPLIEQMNYNLTLLLVHWIEHQWSGAGWL